MSFGVQDVPSLPDLDAMDLSEEQKVWCISAPASPPPALCAPSFLTHAMLTLAPR